MSISRIALGTAWFGTSIPEKEAFQLMDRYAEQGGNLLDTAHMYASWVPDGAGKSESTVGKWIRQANPQRMLIATKGADRGMSRKGIRDQLQESLDRMGRDHIDFYWLHCDDPTVPVAEILGWLNELVGEGLVSAFGCSNWRVKRIIEAMNCAESAGFQGFSASQISWSLASPIPEISETLSQVFMDQNTLKFHRDTDFPVIAYSSQAGGFFAGNYDPEGPSGGGEPNPNIVRLYGSATNYARLEATKSMARAKGCSTNQIALAWMLHQSFPNCAIVGANTVERMVDSCKASEIELTQEEMKILSV